MSVALTIIAAFAFLYSLKLFAAPKPKRNLPPGPKGLLLIGNLLQMPREKEWLTYARWCQIWGDIMSVTALGQIIVIVSSADIAVAMLEKKSSIYSDRPVLTMGTELVGWKKQLALSGYGDHFRNMRRILHPTLGTRSNIKRFHSMFEASTLRFLKRLQKAPEDLPMHIRHATGDIILKIGYGYEVEEKDDPIITLVDTAIRQFTQLSQPGAWLVDLLPFLQYIPSWFPGIGFKKTAKLWARSLDDMANVPYDFVRKQMAAGTAGPSFLLDLLEGKKLDNNEEFSVKWAVASLYSGGADTTVSSIHAFFLAMLLNPDVQAKAQSEIDAVIGTDRLPTLADRGRLPYTDALVKELFRLYPVGPLGLPHRVTQDDSHQDYFIPKGTIVVANIWKILRDPRLYTDPSRFNPARFLSGEGGENNPERDPRDFVFGFGRRVCPGRLLADDSVFISCAMSLAVFKISKAIENGKEIEPIVDFTNGTITHPKPFKCRIEARSTEALALIQSNDQAGNRSS